MRNFDEEPRRAWDEDHRTFLLRGERFVAKDAVRPETLAEFEDRLSGSDRQTFGNLIATTDDVLLKMIEGGEAGDPGDPDHGVPATPPGEARVRYERIRALTENPVTLPELQRIIEWLFEVHAVRPTDPSAASSNGAAATGASLTDSSSPPVTAPVPTG